MLLRALPGDLALLKRASDAAEKLRSAAVALFSLY